MSYGEIGATSPTDPTINASGNAIASAFLPQADVSGGKVVAPAGAVTDEGALGGTEGVIVRARHLGGDRWEVSVFATNADGTPKGGPAAKFEMSTRDWLDVKEGNVKQIELGGKTYDVQSARQVGLVKH